MEGFFANIKEQLKDESGVGAGAGTDWFKPYPIDSKVLECGFGQGELIRKLASLGNEVVGLDIGGASHSQAKEKGTDKIAKLHYLDISHEIFPYTDNYFDEVYCLECIEHLESPGHMFREVKRVLKPDGFFILAFPRFEDNGDFLSGRHAHFYPGFLLKHSFRLFCDQMYFKLLKYKENGSSSWVWLKNIKTGNEIGTQEIIRGNFSYEQLFSHLHDEEAWKEENDPPYIYKVFQSINLFRNIKYLEKEGTEPKDKI